MSKPIPAHHYTSETPVDEVLEVTLTLRNPEGHKVGPTFTLLATNDQGVIRTSMTSRGTPWALEAIQYRSNLSRKVSPGWQVRVIEWAADSLYTVDEVN